MLLRWTELHYYLMDFGGGSAKDVTIRSSLDGLEWTDVKAVKGLSRNGGWTCLMTKDELLHGVKVNENNPQIYLTSLECYSRCC